MTAITIGQTVDIGHGRGRLAPVAAASVLRIDAQLGRPADINSAWRDPVLQQKMRDAWLAYAAGRGPWAPFALEPEDSVHCEGEAADSDDWYNAPAAAVWRDNGWRQTARYPNDPKKDEPWHGEHFPHLDNHRNDGAPASGASKPFPTPTPEEDMFTIYRCGGAVLIVGQGTFLHLGSELTKKTGVDGQETIDAFVKAGAKIVDIPDRRVWDVLRVNIIAGMS
jgi:hypothetical protein